MIRFLSYSAIYPMWVKTEIRAREPDGNKSNKRFAVFSFCVFVSLDISSALCEIINTTISVWYQIKAKILAQMANVNSS